EQQYAAQHLRVVRHPAPIGKAGTERRKVDQPEQIYQEPGGMVGRQAVLQPHLHLQRRLVVRRPELPTHPPTVSLLAMPARSPARTIYHTIHSLLLPPLSDRLLVVCAGSLCVGKELR